MSWLGLAAFVMAAVALLRSRDYQALQRRLARLELELSRLAGRAPQDVPEPTPQPTPAPVSEPTSARVAPPAVAPAAVASAPVPPAAPARPRAPRFSLPELPRIDWERWIGVRGAAVLGGVVLALAGLYFFQYSIEHGLIPPWLRVLVGTLAGLGCVAGAELRARGRYESLANGLVGGGIVVLYAAFWAASVRYHLVAPALGFALMIAVTGACTALAYRHASLVIAMIGLIGGFATPFLLSSGSNRPIALFAYILLLDACLLFVARRRGWPVLALVSLVGTLFYQAAWIGGRMEPHQVAIALCVIGVFAAFYAFALRNQSGEARQERVTQAGAVLFPFAFALYLAARAEFGAHFYPVAILLALLSASACALGRSQGRAWLGLGAASGVLAVSAAWLLRTRLDVALAWESTALCVLLAAVFHVFVELDRRDAVARTGVPAAILAAAGLHVLTIVTALGNGTTGLWPWLAGWLAFTALSLRHGGFPGRARLQIGAAALLGAGWWVHRWWHGAGYEMPDFTVHSGAVLAVAIALQAVAMLRRDAVARRQGEHAAAIFAALLLCSFAPAVAIPPLPALAVAALLGVFVLFSAARAPDGRWVVVGVALTALVHLTWTSEEPLFSQDAGSALRALGIQLGATVLFTAWPFLAFARLRGERFAWYGSALAGPAWFLSLRALYETAFGSTAIGLLPIALGALSLAAAWQANRLREAKDSRRTSNLAWYGAASLGFLTVAIPLQLDREWITIGWALEGLAATLLWRRLDHVGLKYFALALLFGATVRLVANDSVLAYYPRPGFRVVNWLLYTYLVPAAAMIGAARVLGAHEVARARAWERPLYARGYAVGSILAGFSAACVIFVWINLAIADVFASGETLRLGFERTPARDLTTSIAWALYALALLAVGVRARNPGARWLSLALMMVTVAKVFLYDLGELEDLYRVASLLGLAISLILVSFAYQRFVVSRSDAGEPEERR
ncbi:MAG TPA: DUF2339 domain-containing protein [Myxococcota bacterium]|nr:DUF2339 domain-containing protein [Myxococcota bacterium]